MNTIKLHEILEKIDNNTRVEIYSVHRPKIIYLGLKKDMGKIKLDFNNIPIVEMIQCKLRIEDFGMYPSLIIHVREKID